jgi:macrophage erythroblast attacher
VPYAHHTKSYVESDPVILPNGRIYGRERLLEMGRKVGTVGEGRVKDPTTGDLYRQQDMKKVYIM